jgi:hypothetical protein
MSDMKTKQRQPPGTGLPVRNDILRALLNSEYKHLSPKLEHVHLSAVRSSTRPTNVSTTYTFRKRPLWP